jgi:hypothetical protein
MAKPDAQTVSQMAATIASGLAGRPHEDMRDLSQWAFSIAGLSVLLARAIVAEVERTQPEEQEP